MAALALILLLLPCTIWVRAAARENGRFGVIRVGYFDYGSFLDRDENGNYSGYGYEYLEEISNYTGWRYEFVCGTWRELLRKLADGEIDLLGPAQYTAERARLYDYSKYEYGQEYTAVFAQNAREDVYYGDPETFRDKRVAMVKGSYQNGRFERYVRENGIACQEIYFDSWEEADAAIKAGQVDLRVSGSLRSLPDEQVVLKIAPEPFYFIATKGSGVMAEVDQAMEEIRAWDTNYTARLDDKYYNGETASVMAFTREEAECLKTRGALRVAYNAGWMPLCYESGGTACGVLPGLLDNMARDRDLTLAYIPAQSADEMEELVRTGQADVMCYYPRDRLQAARDGGMMVTRAYLTVPVGMVVPAHAPQEPLRRVALPKGQTNLACVVTQAHPGAEIQYYPDVSACLDAVRSGSVDGAFENTYILTQLLKNRNDLELSQKSLVQWPLGIAVSGREDPALLSALNKMIAQVSETKKNAIVLDYTVEAVRRRNALDFLRRIGPAALLVVVAGLFLLVFKSRRVLERYAFMDPLTGGINQTKFALEGEKRIRDKCDGRYAVMCFDIDRFKVINDLHGFRMGNLLLQSIAKTLKAHLAGDELFCRASGDNYVLLLNNGERLDERAAFLLDRVSDAGRDLAETVRYTVSAGLYVIGEPVEGIHIAIDRANLARQTIKSEHQTLAAFYTEEMRKRLLREQELENRLESALANGEFQVYYQPKFSVDGGEIVGAEALVRWNASDGMIYPDEFIPLFESNGTIIKVDLYVFRMVCRHLQKWMRQGVAPYPVSVNLSRAHLYQADFYEEYLSIMEEYGIPAYYVELELTESTMFENQEQLVRVMAQMKDRGMSISMDDFGSGYSSLNLLKDLPIDSLKIDRAFFNESTDSDRGKKIIYSIVTMARQLDILVVSEGVETQAHVDFLRAINCQVAQGYYFSKPLPLAQFELLAFGKTILEEVNV